MASPGSIELALRRTLVARRFARAVGRGEVSLHYQPIVSLRTGDIVAAEALVRWRGKGGGLIPPNSFLPYLRGTSQAATLQRFVLGSAVRQARAWQRAGRSIQVTINVSPESVTAALAGDVDEALSRAGLPAQLLHVELTELRDGDDRLDERAAALQELRRLGVSVSLDDFGRAEASLDRLVNLPLDILKIDRSFIAAMEHDRDSAGIVRNSTRLAHTLELSAIGEGVETEEQWRRLRAWGCDYAQGFLISRPLPAEGFMARLASDVVPVLDRLSPLPPSVERRPGPADRRRGSGDQRARGSQHWPRPMRRGARR